MLQGPGAAAGQPSLCWRLSLSTHTPQRRARSARSCSRTWRCSRATGCCCAAATRCRLACPPPRSPCCARRPTRTRASPTLRPRPRPAGGHRCWGGGGRSQRALHRAAPWFCAAWLLSTAPRGLAAQPRFPPLPTCAQGRPGRPQPQARAAIVGHATAGQHGAQAQDGADARGGRHGPVRRGRGGRGGGACCAAHAGRAQHTGCWDSWQWRRASWAAAGAKQRPRTAGARRCPWLSPPGVLLCRWLLNYTVI